MEWSKIKNIVIIILLLLNAFLLFIVVGREVQDTYSRENARRSAISILRDNGVALEDETVPHNMDHGPMLITRDLELEREQAARLLGADVAVEARGGDVYRYYNEKGSIQFHSGGEFQAQFAPGAFPLEGQEMAAHAAGVLAQLGFSGRLQENAAYQEEYSLTFRQELDGAPVLTCQATLNYSGGSLLSITDGRRLTGVPAADGDRSAISVATALMRLFHGLRELGDIYNRIDSIVPGYTLSVSLSGPARLTPVWYVRTDTGAYQLDAVTGNLTRASERAELGMSDPAAAAGQNT